MRSAPQDDLTALIGQGGCEARNLIRWLEFEGYTVIDPLSGGCDA